MPDVIFAYVDPGTGSYLLQVALAGLLAGSYAVRHFWHRVKSYLPGGQRGPDIERSPASGQDDAGR